ncbi:hypothetical protein NE237_018179 [Protea cynaroides]|uniref:Lysine ketoglutarate reductase trans-splicing-like protein n=1 Tax=Protea cynaroides TaxID=273540 RepID=A0A9Q0QNR1_9MAGN|nr:hypothetical protein NE237_018179 [Protea cynaroides]
MIMGPTMTRYSQASCYPASFDQPLSLSVDASVFREMMKILNWVSVPTDPRSRSCLLCSLLLATALICVVFFTGGAFITTDYKERLSRWIVVDNMQKNPKSNMCKNQCKPYGSEVLPMGIISKLSNLEMQPLWDSPKKKKSAKQSMNLLALAVGIKQKENVNQMVKKFLSSNFLLMLFHYDGVVDEWREFEWSDQAIHISAFNQTKWWFAKRFLHPDIVAEYNYIFLWDEDLGLKNFHPRRYLSIIKDEGLEISQPALDPTKSEIHHQITVRGRKSRVHRRIYKSKGRGQRCDDNSTAPPCTGWVEMMAPVFSRAAWRCSWFMIQNDLIHAWGLDMQLGYCAQGNRTKNVGVVDSEYIVHLGLPTLGVTYEDKAPSGSSVMKDNRAAVRWRSNIELETFKTRWRKAKTTPATSTDLRASLWLLEGSPSRPDSVRGFHGEELGSSIIFVFLGPLGFSW